MKTSSSSSRCSDPAVLAAAALLAWAPWAARAADAVSSYSRMGEGFILQKFSATRHFYHENLFEKATLYANDGEAVEELSFAEHHRTNLRWTAGYGFTLTDLAAAPIPGGTLPARTDLGHEVSLGLGYLATPKLDMAIDAKAEFVPIQEYRAGTVGITFGYVSRFKAITDELGITSEKVVEQPRTIEEYERELLKAGRHLRGFASPEGLEPRLDWFKFDFRYPTAYFGLTLEATKYDQERFRSRKGNWHVFQRRLAVALGYSEASFSAGLLIHVHNYNGGITGLAAKLAADLRERADHRGFLAKVQRFPAVVLEGSVFLRPARDWELGGRLVYTTFEVAGVTSTFTIAPSVGRRIGERWSAALGGEMVLGSGSSSLSGNLFVAYYL